MSNDRKMTVIIPFRVSTAVIVSPHFLCWHRFAHAHVTETEFSNNQMQTIVTKNAFFKRIFNNACFWGASHRDGADLPTLGATSTKVK